MASKLSHSEQDVQSLQTLRIVLVGKTGVGKSASGNTILGKKQAFVSKLSSSQMTENCEKQEGQSGGQFVSIVDTPGLFGKTEMKEALNEIKKCISMSAPGPHVFLVVVQAGRFTPEEKHTVNMIKMTFGKKAEGYTMVLFTRGDDLEEDGEKIAIEELINGSEDLKAFVKQCEGGYHVFDNKSRSDPVQVTELLRKINTMVKKNGGRNYTDVLFKEAEKAITEEIRMIMMKEPGLSEEEARKRAEKENSFIRKYKLVIVGLGGAIGAGGLGGLGGALAGPVGVGVGAAAGAAAGGAAADAYVSDKCILQ